MTRIKFKGDVVISRKFRQEKYSSRLKKLAALWNNSPRRQYVKKLKIRHCGTDAGQYCSTNDTILLDLDIRPSLINPHLEHELAHCNFFHYANLQRLKWIKGNVGMDPITEYAAEYKDNHISAEITRRFLATCESITNMSKRQNTIIGEVAYLVEKAKMKDAIDELKYNDSDIINGKLLRFGRREYNTSINAYANEQHSEFLSIYFGGRKKYDKDVFEKLKSLYLAMFIRL